MSEAAKPVENLLPETIAASKEKALAGSFDGKRLLKILGELSKIDETVKASLDKLHSRGVKFGFAAFFGLFACAFLTAFTGLWPAFVVPVALGVICARDLISAHRMKKGQDLLDDFRVLVRPVLRDILTDLDPAKKIKARFDLSGLADRKKTSEKELPPGRYQKLTETVHHDPWCELKLPLADGSTFTLEIVNEYHKFSRRYKGRSGKIKWKSKWRKDAAVSASLLPPPGGGWGDTSKVAQPDEKLKSFDKDGLSGRRLERFWSFKGTNEEVADVSPPHREVVGMMLRLHNALAGGSKS